MEERCSRHWSWRWISPTTATEPCPWSKPWPDALQVFTGSREMSGAALVEYFKPLKAWLDVQNKGKPTGW